MSISQLNKEFLDFFKKHKPEANAKAHGLCYQYGKELMQMPDHSYDRITWRPVAFSTNYDVQWYWTGGNTINRGIDGNVSRFDLMYLVVSANSMTYKHLLTQFLQKNQDISFKRVLQDNPMALFSKYWLMTSAPQAVCLVFEIELANVNWGLFCDILEIEPESELCENL